MTKTPYRNRKVTVLAKRYNAAHVLMRMPRIFHERLDLLRVFIGFRVKKMKTKSKREQIMERLQSARLRTELLGDCLIKNTRIGITLSQFLTKNDIGIFISATNDCLRVYEGLNAIFAQKNRLIKMLEEKIQVVIDEAKRLGIDSMSLSRAKSRMSQYPEVRVLSCFGV